MEAKTWIDHEKRWTLVREPLAPSKQGWKLIYPNGLDVDFPLWSLPGRVLWDRPEGVPKRIRIRASRFIHKAMSE